MKQVQLGCLLFACALLLTWVVIIALRLVPQVFQAWPQDAPASLTGLHRCLVGVLMQYTNKAAMQLVLVQSCYRRNTALASWLHQQACAYLDALMHLSQETLRELARVATQIGGAASDDQQQASLEGANGTIDLLVPGSRQA